MAAASRLLLLSLLLLAAVTACHASDWQNKGNGESSKPAGEGKWSKDKQPSHEERERKRKEKERLRQQREAERHRREERRLIERIRRLRERLRIIRERARHKRDQLRDVKEVDTGYEFRLRRIVLQTEKGRKTLILRSKRVPRVYCTALDKCLTHKQSVDLDKRVAKQATSLF